MLAAVMDMHKPPYVVTFCLFAVFVALVTAAAPQPAPAWQAPPNDTPLTKLTFVAFDTETTGFGAKQNRIVEIGAVKFKDGEEIAEKTWLINPERPIPYWANRVHGIDDKMVADSPTFAEVYPEFLAFIGDSVLIAHNARFDVDFMHASIERAGLQHAENPVIDSLRLFRAWFPDADSHSLEPLSADLGLAGDVYHRATDDSRYIFLIMDHWLRKHGNATTYGKLLKDAGETLQF
jgi:DNA polymerase-3 subunit alpha (Gram-positive type)